MTGTRSSWHSRPTARSARRRSRRARTTCGSALNDLFGISPAITCVVREARESWRGPALVELVDEEEVPDDAEALRRVQEMLGAQPVEGGE